MLATTGAEFTEGKGATLGAANPIGALRQLAAAAYTNAICGILGDFNSTILTTHNQSSFSVIIRDE